MGEKKERKKEKQKKIALHYRTYLGFVASSPP
jgi:hypothetical protein